MSVFILGAILFFSALGSNPLRSAAEVRCILIVKTMLKTGDYAMPRFDADGIGNKESEERVNKPPLFYWCSVVANKLAGGFSMFAFRFPSAIAGLATLALVMAWGRELKCPQTGILAAALLAVTYLFVYQARFASFEMMLTFFANACLLACYRLVQSPTWSRAVVATLLFSLGFLTKATPILLLAPAPLAVWLIGMKRYEIFRNAKVWLLFLLGLLAGISWHLYIFAFYPQARQVFISEALLPFGVKALGQHSATHYEKPWYFLRSIWGAAAPLSYFLPLSALLLWRNRCYPANSAWRLLSRAFLVPFIVFSVIPQKQGHYILPLMIPLALLTAHAIISAIRAPSISNTRLLYGGLVCAAVSLLVFLVVGSFSLYVLFDFRIAAVLIYAVAMLSIMAVFIFALCRRQWINLGIWGIAGMAMWWCLYFVAILPVEDGFNSGKIFTDPDYNATQWEARFKRFPFLKNKLDYDRGLKRADSYGKLPS